MTLLCDCGCPCGTGDRIASCPCSFYDDVPYETLLRMCRMVDIVPSGSKTKNTLLLNDVCPCSPQKEEKLKALTRLFLHHNKPSPGTAKKRKRVARNDDA